MHFIFLQLKWKQLEVLLSSRQPVLASGSLAQQVAGVEGLALHLRESEIAWKSLLSELVLLLKGLL